ncbi:glutamate ligase domain-containing protein [Kitasatospora sp. NPDC057936]|uniref:glutamate ligase domain-containing protein n=1 Tax=Kitasatospora sp. NPDC057936 TaxID=3346283 RepID=UPI0036DAB18A
MLHVHQVPMCRQLVPVEEWEQQGGTDLGDRLTWSNRACGMAALRMILLAYGMEPPVLTELIKIGVKRDALTDRGWLHAGIAEIAADFDIAGQAEPVPAEELTERLAKAPLIISVTEQFPSDGRRGGHLVVAHGFELGDDPVIHFRDPSAWGQDNDRVPLSRLAKSYTGRAITFPPLPAVGRTIAVLGEMGELGEDAASSHREIGRYVAEQGIDLLIAVGGDLPKQLALAAAAHGTDVAMVADAETAAAYLESIVRPGDKVLVKASRSAMLWQVCQRLLGQDVTGW